MLFKIEILIIVLVAGIYSAVSVSAQAEGFLHTDSVVHTDIVESSPTNGKVSLIINNGWHVNANPASMGFLIPTTLKPEPDDHMMQVVYPQPKSIITGLGNINVFSGQIDVQYSFTDLSKKNKLILTAQACNEDTCLPPSNWTFELNSKNGTD